MPLSLEPAPSVSVSAEVPAMETAAARRGKSIVREYAEAIGIALLLALFIRTYVVQAFKIPSGSMLPTLQVGDHILVNKFIYGTELPMLGRVLPITSPQRGDVIVFIYPVDPSKDFIKRVIAVAGDEVQVRRKHVYINGMPWDDPYAYFGDGEERERGRSPRDNYGPVTIPPEHVFVMGDNRDRSYDSRFWGFVDLDQIKGKAFAIYWSWDGTERWVRWDRLGTVIR
jgi:signal peptidase I